MLTLVDASRFGGDGVHLEKVLARRGSDEVYSLLLNIVLSVLLHLPADKEKQQYAQCLVGHLQAQVSVGQRRQEW